LRGVSAACGVGAVADLLRGAHPSGGGEGRGQTRARCESLTLPGISKVCCAHSIVKKMVCGSLVLSIESKLLLSAVRVGDSIAATRTRSVISAMY
jgi:hypothetical protein